MPDLYQFSELEMISFFLVLVRLSAFVVSWPVFGSQIVPFQLKVLFALTMAFVIFPHVNASAIHVDMSSNQIIWLVLREAFIGVTLGFMSRLLFQCLFYAL